MIEKAIEHYKAGRDAEHKRIRTTVEGWRDQERYDVILRKKRA